MTRRRPPHRSWDPRRTPDPDKLRRAVEAHTRGDAETAAQLYVELEQQYPPHWHARMMGALLHYQRTSDPTEVLDMLPAVILAKPLWPDPRYNLGVVLEGLGRFEEAKRRFEQTVEMEPAHSQAWTNLGNVRLALGDVDGALEAFNTALALDPGDPLGMYNLSHVFGLLGRWDECWRLFEYRWLAPGHLRDHGLPKLVPAWDGTPTGHLIATGEQGAGDTIQYARFIPRLQRLSRELTVIVRHTSLVPLLEVAFPRVRFLGIGADVSLSEMSDLIPEADAHIPLMSVVARLGLSPAHVRTSGYLHINPVMRLTERRTIGVCWAGSPSHKRDATRSIPFETFAPILDIPDVQWLNLTLNDRGAVEHPQLMHLPAGLNYLETAAMIRTIDGVVTIDSSPLHLAGALGVPTLGLIGAAPDFRWGMHAESTPWYDRVTLLRQERAGSWDAVVQEAKRRIVEGIFPPTTPEG